MPRRCPYCRRRLVLHVLFAACAMCGALLDVSGPDTPATRIDPEARVVTTVAGATPSTRVSSLIGGSVESLGWVSSSTSPNIDTS